jgi:hypothetical protein
MDKPAADAGRFNTPAGRFNTLEDAGDVALAGRSDTLNFAIHFSQTLRDTDTTLRRILRAICKALEVKP